MRWLDRVRTSWPALPSGRSAASTSQMVPAAVCAEQTRVISAAIRVAIVIARSLVISGSPFSSASRFGDEEHIHIADVVELLRAALAEPDHRQSALARILAYLCPADGQRRAERGIGQIGQLAGDVVQDLDRLGRSQVAGRDPEQRAPVGQPQAIPGQLGGATASGIGPHSRQQLGAELLRRRAAEHRRRAHPPVRDERSGAARGTHWRPAP